MVIPKTLQGYAGGSEVIGDYGRPWDFRAGVNYFLSKTESSAGTGEFLYTVQVPGRLHISSVRARRHGTDRLHIT